MLAARRACSLHRTQRQHGKGCLRAGHDQVVSIAAVVEASRPRLAENAGIDRTESWEPSELLHDDADVLLDTSGPWTSDLAVSAYAPNGDGLVLEDRKRSNAEASSSSYFNGNGKRHGNGLFEPSRSLVHAPGATNSKQSGTQAAHAAAVDPGILSMQTADLASKPKTFDGSANSSENGVAAVAAADAVVHGGQSKLAALLDMLEQVGTSSAPFSAQTQQQRRVRRLWQAADRTTHPKQKAPAPARSRSSPAAAAAAPTLSDASLTCAIAAASSCTTLHTLFQQHQHRMNITHTSFMMKQLSRQISDSASHMQLMTKFQADLWGTLRDRALFTMRSAQLRHVADVLSAVHLVAESKEEHDLGWARAVPPSMLDRPYQQQQQQHVGRAGDRQLDMAKAISESDSQLHETAPVNDAAAVDIMFMAVEVPDAADLSEQDTSGGLSSRGSSPASASPVTYPPSRPLHSSRAISRHDKELVQACLQRSQELMQRGHVTEGDLLRLLSAVGRLGFAAGEAWQEAFFQATLRALPRMGKSDLVSLACGVSRLQPTRRPSAAWLTEFYSRSQQLMPGMDARELTSVLVCASRLPRPHPVAWIDSSLQRCTDSLDSFDAPAYALLLHSLGRMRQRPPRAWVQELLENSTSLLYDFSPEELSLVLRGCAMLRAKPGDDWLHEFYASTQTMLRRCSGPQLANMAWALALLKCRPPKQWVHGWLQEIRRTLHAGGRPVGVSRSMWHGIGYAVHAKRASVAMEALRVPDLDLWCRWLRTPMPRRTKGIKMPGEEPGEFDDSAEEQGVDDQGGVDGSSMEVDV